jgi:hypothetical protein
MTEEEQIILATAICNLMGKSVKPKAVEEALIKAQDELIKLRSGHRPREAV